jgi:hypothetical protein
MSDKERAQELLESVKECMRELNDIFRRADRLTRKRWQMYPCGHIAMALDHDHEYMGKSIFTVQGLIDGLPDDDDESDDDDCSPPANEIDSIEDEVREP